MYNQDFLNRTSFVLGNALDSLKAHRGKYCMESFIDHIEAETKSLYEVFPKLPVIRLIEILLGKHNEAAKCQFCMKYLDDLDNTVITHSFARVQLTQQL